MKFNLTPSQANIVKRVQDQAQGEIFVVGGAVRDLLLEREPKDIDFTTSLKPKSVQALLKTLGFVIIPDQTAWDHGIVRTVDKHDGKIIDIATLREDNNCDGRHACVTFTKDLYKDLARRDLTINAMAAAISPNGTVDEVIDPFGGQESIEYKVIRFVGSSD